MTQTGVVVGALVRRALNEILRVPGAAIPGVLAPTIFMIGLSAVFGEAAQLRGFEADSFREFIVPVGMLQGAAFTGAATGVNLARDIEQGWFDRLLVCPAPRVALLLGLIGSAALRALLPMTFLLLVAFAMGVDWPGVDTVLLGAVLVMALAATIASYAIVVALRFRTQAAAPLMQVAGFVAVLFTTAYAPKALMADWLETVATINPVTLVLEGVRQGFVGDVTWADTWPALVAVSGLVTVFGLLAMRGMRRVGV
ncbi:MAG TPA: ABC transporter permease [Baekduia sp.]|nr:ABC transporter permease [Baekduia sp.]